MHDTFDPDPDTQTDMSSDTPHARARKIAEQNLTRPGNPEALARALAAEQPPADRPPAEPRKRDWHNVGTRVRTTRLSDELWDAVKAEAERTGSTTSTIVRDALDAYLDRRP